MLAFASCHAKPPLDEPAASSIVGLLTFAFGDPASGGLQAQYHVSVTDSSGRTVVIRVDSAATIRVEDLRRFQGARVRAVGRYRGKDRTVLWITAVDSAVARSLE